MAASALNPAEESTIEHLRHIIQRLRGSEGCPWDRQQTPRSMALYLLEETYELVEAIAAAPAEEVCEELGDVLFHILFLSELYGEMGCFDLKQVADGAAAKMIRRHPHVFGEDQVADVADVRRRWHQIKASEKSRRAGSSVLDSVPRRLPALLRAYRIGERAARSRAGDRTTGLGASELADLVQSVEKQWQTLKTSLLSPPAVTAKHSMPAAETGAAFGEMLFTLANVARVAGFHPESALAEATRQFELEFKQAERERMTDPDAGTNAGPNELNGN